ncbi:MAG TPA: hydrogen peroxide-dependent heme synthase [Actinomycetota bacterium]|nr:hydrogen peroxide-dependent heme synthase [Actinomycetota bacterium]
MDQPPVKYASYPVFKTIRDRLEGLDRGVAAKEVVDLLDRYSDRVETRGIYSTSAFTAAADLMIWWVADDIDVIEELTIEFKRTQLGRTLEQTEAFLGITMPAEFSKDHLPAFAKGEPPKKYICVYPYVRTHDWYLLEPAERGSLLREHGEAGREFPDILANTTSAFGLGDYEWILCFEADTPVRIVELMRRLRATEARRFTKVEIPFVTGIRKDAARVIEDLA